MKQLVHWVTDDGGKAALQGHSPILLSSLTGQCLPVYPDRVFIYPFFSAREALHNEAWTVLQGGRCGWTPLNPLMFGHRTVCPFMARGNERQLCARARRASSVWEPRPVPKFPTVALDTAAWGWEGCERPLSPRDAVEGGHGQLASGLAKERKGTVRNWTRCGSTAANIPCSPAPLEDRCCCVASVCGSGYATVHRPALVKWCRLGWHVAHGGRGDRKASLETVCHHDLNDNGVTGPPGSSSWNSLGTVRSRLACIFSFAFL